MTTDAGTTNVELDARLIEKKAVATAMPAGNSHDAKSNRQSYDAIVIGGGQAGLAVGYHLARAGFRFVILDANARIGDSWRKRWDSLRLFTPAKFDSLAGMPFPAPRNAFPTKDEMAAYLEAYADRFELPVRNGVRVERLTRHGTRYVARSGALEFEADHVVVAMANYQRPKLPAFASGLSGRIVQMHSSDYRNLRQLQPGGVLIVGAGNSGAELAMETTRGGHATWLSGADVGHIPFRPEGVLGRNVFSPLLLKVVFHRLLTVRTPLGRRVRPKMMGKATPLIRVKPDDLAAAGVQRVRRVVGVRDGRPLLDDGRALDVANVIWSTGFHPGSDWIDLPIFGEDGRPRHEGGLVAHEPGVYFVGLTFLFAMSSSMIHGVSRDAHRIVDAIKARVASAASRTEPLTSAPRRAAKVPLLDGS